ncbi:RES family NAD+ phosphorylase [Croceicoccus sp. Ery15]|uniref:RES family NAD+ phosphorylase n=1 Tax=Croceicoccus sp. Ery15 TaxID=1703338 RepID=UPI0021051983|nr:RES family NAD+ phosphorylase [Croceicoccus sp. Ery15]
MLYLPNEYSAAQALASQLRAANSDGIIYQSVRDNRGECVAVFRPRLLSNCRQERNLFYVWDGKGISKLFEKSKFTEAARFSIKPPPTAFRIVQPVGTACCNNGPCEIRPINFNAFSNDLLASLRQQASSPAIQGSVENCQEAL